MNFDHEELRTLRLAMKDYIRNNEWINDKKEIEKNEIIEKKLLFKIWTDTREHRVLRLDQDKIRFLFDNETINHHLKK